MDPMRLFEIESDTQGKIYDYSCESVIEAKYSYVGVWVKRTVMYLQLQDINFYFDFGDWRMINEQYLAIEDFTVISCTIGPGYEDIEDWNGLHEYLDSWITSSTFKVLILKLDDMKSISYNNLDWMFLSNVKNWTNPFNHKSTRISTYFDWFQIIPCTTKINIHVFHSEIIDDITEYLRWLNNLLGDKNIASINLYNQNLVKNLDKFDEFMQEKYELAGRTPQTVCFYNWFPKRPSCISTLINSCLKKYPDTDFIKISHHGEIDSRTSEDIKEFKQQYYDKTLIVTAEEEKIHYTYYCPSTK